MFGEKIRLSTRFWFRAWAFLLVVVWFASCESQPKAEAPATPSKREDVNPESYINKEDSISGLQKRLEELNALLANAPQDLQSLHERIVLSMGLNDPAQALEDINLCLQLQPDDLNALQWKVEALTQLQRLEEALQVQQTILARFPEAANTLKVLGNLKLRMGKFSEAVIDLGEYLERKPTDAEARADRGSALYALGMEEEAYQDFVKCGDLVPQAINGRGLVLQFVDQDDVAARVEFERARRLFPSDAEAYFNLAFLEAGKGDKAMAQSLFTQAIERDSMYWDAWLNRGLVEMQLGKHLEAEVDFDKVCSKQTTNMRARLLRGWARCEQGKWLQGCLDLTDAKVAGLKDAENLSEKYQCSKKGK